MAASQQLVIQQLAANPSLATQAAADPAGVAATLSVPNARVPVTVPITLVTLGAAWGFAAAATFQAALQAGIAAGGATGAQFAYFLQCLGVGVNASDPNAQEAAAQLVTAGLVTQDQVNAVLYQPLTYPCGDVVTAAEVTAALAAMALNTAVIAIRSAVASLLNEWLNPLAITTASPPTQSQVVAQLQTCLTASGINCGIN